MTADEPTPKAPRDFLTAWPGGQVRKGVDEELGRRALEQALLVRLIEAHRQRYKSSLSACAVELGVPRSTLDRALAGQSWPAFWVLAGLARVLHYDRVWTDLGKALQDR